MSVALLILLVGGSGLALLGVVDAPLRLEERIAAAIVAAVVLDSSVCFLLALAIGFTPLAILAAPSVVGVAAGLLAWRTCGLVKSWRVSWEDAMARHRERKLLSLLVIIAVIALATVALFFRAMFFDNGNLVSGYWLPDWSQHLITASSFSVANNLPPQNPIFSGTPLDYPFLPDLASAMLMRLGLSAGPALALPQALLCVLVALLVICLAERLGARRGVGVIAVAICFLGGGLGFLGAFDDACAQRGYNPTQCSLGHVLTHPVEGVGVAAATIRGLPTVMAAQPRAYDGMPSLQPQGATPVADNQQWYTPLFGWWLPQRSLVFGFASVLVVLTILSATLEGPELSLGGVALAGVVAGLLPLVHVHSLFALVIIVAGLAVTRRRPAWLVFAGITAVIAAPRMIQLAAAPHGSEALGNAYPWFEPGWLSKAIDSSAIPRSLSPGTLWAALVDAVRLPFVAGFWRFWFVNLGVAVPLALLFVLAAAARALPAESGAHGLSRFLALVRRAAGHICSAVPAPLLRFCLCCMPIFVIANLLVFQSWDWDNTKLFAYWYLGVALLIGAIVVHWWRGVWRTGLAVLLAASVLGTGTLVVLRLIPFHPACSATVATGCYGASITGPYAVVPAADLGMANAVISSTATSAVFLTSTRFNDPIPVMTGRPVVMGYEGWLWSYGIDYAQRKQDVAAALSGCGSTPLAQCATILEILHRYTVSYVEVDSTDSQPSANADWWAAQHLDVIAHSDHIVVYDVRGQ